MREIKFRGISVNTKEFEYGLLVFMCGVGGWAIEQTFDCPPTLSDPGGSSDYKRHGIINDTEGQYTGLKDKNGKEIFEGDIFKYYGYRSLPEIGQVLFKNGSFIYNIDGDELLLLDLINSLEIIGNIHQNPDLL